MRESTIKQQTRYICGYTWQETDTGIVRTMYVADEQHHIGDWEYTDKCDKAKPLSRYWMRRFKANVANFPGRHFICHKAETTSTINETAPLPTKLVSDLCMITVEHKSGTRFILLPESLRESCGICTCPYCNHTEGQWDTLAIPRTGFTYRVHFPALRLGDYTNLRTKGYEWRAK